MKRIVVLGVLFLLLTIIVVLGTSFTTKKTPIVVSPTPTPYSLSTLNSWKDVIPGSSTLSDVVTKLGQPISTIKNGDTETLLYPSTNQYWKNEVTVTNNAVSFIKERVFSSSETSFKKLSARIQEPPTQLYGPDFEGGTYVIVYSKSGLAFEVNVSQDMVYQVWHFPPTTLAGFLALPEATAYSISPKLETEGGM